MSAAPGQPGDGGADQHSGQQQPRQRPPPRGLVVAEVELDAEDEPILEPGPGETPLWRELSANALFEAGAAPHQAVMIGDTSFDMDMARAAGMTGFGVGWGYHRPDLLTASGAALVAADFADLGQALARWAAPSPNPCG